MRAWAMILIVGLLHGGGAVAAPTLTEPVLAAMATLLELGGHGRFPTERAAFVLEAPEGVTQCLLWPADRQFQQASFTGSVPPGTAFIAHTHPKDLPLPSAADRQLADRIGLPVVVVTPKGIVAALPGKETSVWMKRGRWAARATQRGIRCGEEVAGMTTVAQK